MESTPLPGAPSLPAAADLADRIGAALGALPVPPPSETGLPSAVLILLYERDGEPHLVLTKRTDTLEHHPGQISLPGGRFDAADGDLERTALRETFEELGVDPAGVRVLGRLADVQTQVTGFVVTPFIGVTDLPLVPVPSISEIARVLEIPIADILAADELLPAAADIVSLRYPLLGEDVWGATARILRLFSAVVRTALAGAA